jgi:hypothetical protein
MFIDFEDSHAIYTFCGVAESVLRDFINSGSVGRYYHQYIKYRYQCLVAHFEGNAQVSVLSVWFRYAD